MMPSAKQKRGPKGLLTMPRASGSMGNLWLARELWELGAVQFGDFNIGRTVHSPVYLNPRLLIGNPSAFRRSARVMKEEAETLLSMRKPGMATVCARGRSSVWRIAFRHRVLPAHEDSADLSAPGEKRAGRGHRGEVRSRAKHVLIIDDLMTHGTSVIDTATSLRAAGLDVHDAIVLVDRKQGGRERLRQHGINLVAILEIETLLNYLMSNRKIDEETYRRSLDYMKADQETG